MFSILFSIQYNYNNDQDYVDIRTVRELVFRLGQTVNSRSKRQF